MTENKAKLRLGIIGLSEGNGHPYSWSAIFNGYDESSMANCPFPAIPHYLSQQQWPEASIKEGSVDYIWTENVSQSKEIAKSCHIRHVASKPNEMIGHIDGLLLARDDAENHLHFAGDFLSAGIPVYIDKPIAISIRELERLQSHQTYDGQIFSCSALKYAKEMQVSERDLKTLGTLQHISATVPKSWNKYIIHVLDPIFSAIGHPGEAIQQRAFKSDDMVGLFVEWQNGLTAEFKALGKNTVSPIQFTLFGDKSHQSFTFFDSFNAFKTALLVFTQCIKNPNSNPLDWHLTRHMVELIEAGSTS